MRVDLCGLDILTSFLTFVARHGRHMQQLSLTACGSLGEEYSSVAAAVAACLAAAGAAGQLTALEVCDSVPSTEWLASMRSLRSLKLQPLSHMPRVAPAISLLTALCQLELHGNATALAPSVQLPGSITSLRMYGSSEKIMPRQVRTHSVPAQLPADADLSGNMHALPLWQVAACVIAAIMFHPSHSHWSSTHLCVRVQVTQLPALQRLSLEHCFYSAASMEGLSALSGSLTRLKACCEAALPPSLSALTRMQHLDLLTRQDDTDQVNAALARLQQLTCLILNSHSLTALPPAVRRLGRLRLLYFGSTAAEQALPQPGPWLQHLESLAAGAAVLVPSAAVLAATPHLKDVLVASVPDPASATFFSCWTGPAWHAFWAWAAAHPSLSSLSFALSASDSGHIWAPFHEAAMEMRSTRPSLRVDRNYDAFMQMLRA